MANMEIAGKPSSRRSFLDLVTQLDPGWSLRWQGGAFLLVFVAIALLWEGMVRLGWISALLFPPPSRVADAALVMLADGRLAGHLVPTFSRLVIGFTFGGIAGLLLGLAMGSSTKLRRLLDPLVASAHPVPKVSLLPLIMVILGVGEISKIFVISLGAFFPMLINSMSGVRHIVPIYFEVARNYGASPRKIFTRVIIPGSLPMVLAGARLALNTAFVITISVELVAASHGLGSMIWFSWETLRTEELYVGVVVAALMGITLNQVLRRLQSHLVPWQVEAER